MADDDRTHKETPRETFLTMDPVDAVLRAIAIVTVFAATFLAGYLVGATHR